MSETPFITTHLAPDVPGDANAAVEIFRGPPHPRGDSRDYTLTYGDGRSVILEFCGPNGPGLTNEALLAVVLDRLERFQTGPYACPENASAVNGIRLAADSLYRRAKRQAAEAELKKTAAGGEQMASNKHLARVRAGGGTLTIGDAGFQIAGLKRWGAWQAVESACRRLDPPANADELATIQLATSGLGDGAANGFAELKSALASTRKA